MTYIIFNCPLFTFSKKWNIGILAYLVIEKGLKSSPSLPNCSKDYWKLLSLLISINWPSLVASWFVVQKIYSKMHLVSWTNTHRDGTDLVNHGMVKNTKTWISRERNITFLKNKKILKLCLRWRILRNYRFLAEVTFNTNRKKQCKQFLMSTEKIMHFFFLMCRKSNAKYYWCQQKWSWKPFLINIGLK